jgi:aminopeptidase YwaD
MKLKKALYTLFLSIMLWSAAAQSLSEQLELHTQILASDSLEGRGLGTEGKMKAVRYIAAQFREIGLIQLKDDYSHPFPVRIGLSWVSAENLIGVIPGSDPLLKDEYIIVGAHFDHLGYEMSGDSAVIYPGADDNASGVASLIEIGRALQQQKELLKRSVILIAFDAEESGLYGSVQFVKDSIVPVEQIKMMFSLDMVGMLEKNKAFDLIGMGSLVNGEKLAKIIADQHQLKLGKMGKAIQAFTDTKPFGDAGIPAVHAFTGTKSPYHKPEDKADLLDFGGMAKINHYLVDLLVKLSQEEKLEPDAILRQLAAKNDKKSSIEFNGGVTLNVGSGYHKYISEFYRSQQLTNISTGLYGQVHFSRFMSVQGELLYDPNRSKTQDGIFIRQSITAPLNLQIGTPTRKNGFRVLIFGGGYYRYHISAKYKGQKLVKNDDYRKDEWGYNFGVGLEITRFYVGWTARRSLNEVFSNNDNFPRVKDRSNLLTLGYRF